MFLHFYAKAFNDYASTRATPTTLGIRRIFFTLSHLSFFLHVVFFFKHLTSFHAGFVLSFFQARGRSHLAAKVIFKDHKTFQKETCLIDCLKELIPVLLIMASAVTHKPVHKTICAMHAFHTFLLQSSLLKPIFHLLILHDFAHAYLSESPTSLSLFQFSLPCQ
jgi:hypothetical protein